MQEDADKLPPGDYGYSLILIGQYVGAARQGTVDGWWVDTDTVLPTNEQAAGFAEKKKADPGVKATFQRGSHDKDWSCSVTVKRMW